MSATTLHNRPLLPGDNGGGLIIVTVLPGKTGKLCDYQYRCQCKACGAEIMLKHVRVKRRIKEDIRGCLKCIKPGRKEGQKYATPDKSWPEITDIVPWKPTTFGMADPVWR